MSSQPSSSDNTGAEAAAAAADDDDDDYKLKSITEFGLKPCPLEWGDEPNEADSDTEEMDQATWKKYYDYRCQVEKRDREYRGRHRLYASDDSRLLKGIQEQFFKVANSIGGIEVPQDWIRSTTITVVGCTFEDYDELISSSYRSCIFSPYQIPHAIQFTHRYHNRMRWSNVEYFAGWAFKLLRFDGKDPGDARQKHLKNYYPSNNTFVVDDPEYDGMTGEEYLCSNSLVDPPSDKAEWIWCENPEARNLTPTTVTRIREWLYGTPFFQSQALISDLDLMRLVFASMGSPNFIIWLGDIGHTWEITPEHPAASHLQRAGHLEEEWDDFTDVNWLEYAVRLATQSLRPLDMYYEPYDQKKAKSQWGEEVLENFEDHKPVDDMFYGEDEEDDMLLHQVPWMVWEREEKNQGTTSELAEGMKGLAASLMRQQS